MIRSATQDKQNKSFRVIKTILTLLLLVALCLPVGTFGRESNTSSRPQVSVAAPSSESMIVNNDTATTAKNTPVTIDVLANDSDLDGGMLWLASVPHRPMELSPLTAILVLPIPLNNIG